MWPGCSTRDQGRAGNDGFSNNMFEEMKAAYLAHKHNLRNPQTMPGDAVWQMAYDNNAALSRIFFPKPLAELRTGAFADIIFLDRAAHAADDR